MSAKAAAISSARWFRAALSAGSASGCPPAGKLNPNPSIRAGWPGGDVTVATAPGSGQAAAWSQGASQRPSGWTRDFIPGLRRRG